MQVFASKNMNGMQSIYVSNNLAEYVSFCRSEEKRLNNLIWNKMLKVLFNAIPPSKFIVVKTPPLDNQLTIVLSTLFIKIRTDSVICYQEARTFYWHFVYSILASVRQIEWSLYAV